MTFFNKLKSQAASAIKGTVKQKAQNIGNKTEKIVFEDIPETMDAFKALPQAALSTPFDTAALTIVALSLYPMDKELSFQMLDYLRGPAQATGRDRQFVADRFRDKDYVPRSYFNGATPSNDYMPTTPYTITVSTNQYSYEVDGIAKLFIPSGGADSPRPIQLRQAKDGKWYLWEYSSILSGIRQPESSNPWA